MATNIKNSLTAYFSELVILASLMSYIVLVLTDLNSILSRVLDGSETLDYLKDGMVWGYFGLSAIKNLVWLLIGIFTRAIKSVFDAIHKGDVEKAKIVDAAVAEMIAACVASSDPKVVELAKVQALKLISGGVDLYNVASKLTASAKP